MDRFIRKYRLHGLLLSVILCLRCVRTCCFVVCLCFTFIHTRIVHHTEKQSHYNTLATISFNHTSRSQRQRCVLVCVSDCCLCLCHNRGFGLFFCIFRGCPLTIIGNCSSILCFTRLFLLECFRSVAKRCFNSRTGITANFNDLISPLCCSPATRRLRLLRMLDLSENLGLFASLPSQVCVVFRCVLRVCYNRHLSVVVGFLLVLLSLC